MRFQTRNCTGKILQSDVDHISPLAKRVLSARGLDDDKELAFSLKQLHPVSLLGSVEEAAQLLADCIEQQHKIIVVGDYDADGATATALTLRAMRMMGHESINFLVPDRFKYGYGLTPEIVELVKDSDPWLVMTVDNGVSSIEGVEAAKALGYKTLITDHHLPGKQLPDADVMVNPNLVDDDFPSPCLAGVGVVFYIMLAVKRELLNRGYNDWQEEPNLLNLLSLVALGTVADVVPLDRNNRLLVEQGLRRVRAGQGLTGIHALFDCAGKDWQQAQSSDFGFACGPRLNAAGRLADMSIGIRCLLTDDVQEAKALATTLDKLNQERKRIESGMKDDAEYIMQQLTLSDEQNLPPIICLHQDDWHEGVVGILASRIKERYYRPVIIFATTEGEMVKGSGRSIEGLHMRDMIESVATRHPNLIYRFGGHAMAAGLSLKKADLPRFMDAIHTATLEQVTDDSFNEVIYTDGILDDEDLTLARAEELSQLMPWGQHFPEPQFEGEFEIVQLRILKELHVKVKLKSLSSGQVVEGIAFFADLEVWPEQGETVELVYRLSVNEFRAQRNLQLMIEHVKV